MYKTIMLAALALLSACGKPSETTTTGGDADSAPTPEIVRTCESIIREVIRIAATNGVTVVKTYDPKTIKTRPKTISCTGRVLVSTGQEATIYYRDMQDKDGDWLIQYAEQPLEQ